ncbi:integral membrane protein [Paramyrothecium foliicola]|nr:integral membrane protein [Paramyrothecium foliicola]
MGWVVNATPEVDGISQYPTIISICVVLSILSSLVVGTRLFVRHKNRGLAADDWMACLSAVFAVIYSILTIAQTRYGLGLPVKLRPLANLVIYTRVNYAGRPFYQLGISFFKIALLISYLRLLKGTDQKIYRIVVKVAIAVVFISHLACTFSLIFACTPVWKSWTPTYKEGKCLPPGPSFTAYAVVTIICDVIVGIIPLPVLLGLNIQRSKKVGLIGIFTLGLFTTICSIMRYLQINRIQYGDGNSTMLVLWGTIEFNVGNMVSSLPFLAPVFLRKAKEYRYKHSGAYGSSGNEPNKRNRGIMGGEHYKLGSISRSNTRTGGGVNVTNVTAKMSASEENILAGDTSIIKSVTYTVQVSDDEDKLGHDHEEEKRGQPRGIN